MTSWVLEAINTDSLNVARTEAARRLLKQAFGLNGFQADNHDLSFIAEAMELAVIDLLHSDSNINELRAASSDAFQLLRVLPRPEDPLEAAQWCLHLACLGVLGDRTTEAARLLKELPWPELQVDSFLWGDRTLATIYDIWLRLIRKDGWSDLDTVQRYVVRLREQQRQFEAEYLSGFEEKSARARTAAWTLVALYHLAKAAELLAIFTTTGQVNGHYDIREQLDAQFDRASTACGRGELVELSNLTNLLARTAQQLVDNCIWTLTRGVPTKVNKFVQSLVSRPTNPIFELLPPQRFTLREEGLHGYGHRSVVVSLPTSSGKTFIAQFRILQALNQFDQEQGWVAYLAPTRALVNQICARLRRDFAPLEINVERVSPALEVDALEASLLTNDSKATLFRVLVTTPEKLDLMLRGGWEEKIGRPLTLVVVDEAHNLGQKERGIKLELLLATINRECRNAQFLLLTPFIGNATEIAKWLSPDSFNDIHLGVDWQPNDRAVVLCKPEPTSEQGGYSLNLETLHTNKNTLVVPETLPLVSDRPLGLGWSAVKGNASDLAAATAHSIRSRGAVVVLSSRPDWAWSLARRFKRGNKQASGDGDVALVRRFLEREFGKSFELCELLDYGVGVHHAGLSDEAKILIEWLLERNSIDVLVATTTIAQGVNFPIAAVVLAQNKYYDENKGMTPMPTDDFWNLAGRVGRVEQGSLGIIALVATDDNKAAELREFVKYQVSSLNSTLITMVQEAMSRWGELQLHRLFNQPEWSAFLQYLAHTYRQIGDPKKFASEVEQVLRGTLGFQNLRRTRTDWADKLVVSVQNYAERIAGKPLELVDTTGFSWESVSNTLYKLAEEKITLDIWDPDKLFRRGTGNLQKLMGILLAVPELRENLQAAVGGPEPDGSRLAHIVTDWVNGASLPEIAKEYFAEDSHGKPVDFTRALTNCCRNVFGKLSQTASWGLAALQSMTFRNEFDRLSEDEQQTLRNLPARVYYGVNTNEAIALRLLGVPRGAAEPLANSLKATIRRSNLPNLRKTLSTTDVNVWTGAIGEAGADYFNTWKILEGLS
jgi:superfamily II DNA/RNA helicase